MDEPKIPEDLKDIYKEAQMNTECEGTFNDGFVAELIERIAKLQTERDALLVALKEAKRCMPVGRIMNDGKRAKINSAYARINAAIKQAEIH